MDRISHFNKFVEEKFYNFLKSFFDKNNFWNERQLYQDSPHIRCSMESHISHIFADLFTSRPKAYSKKELNNY